MTWLHLRRPAWSIASPPLDGNSAMICHTAFTVRHSTTIDVPFVARGVVLWIGWFCRRTTT